MNGSKITFYAYNAGGTLTIGNKSFVSGETYTYAGVAGNVVATAAGVSYMSGITLVSPVNPSTDIPEPPAEVEIKATVTGLDAADESAVKVIGKIGSTVKVIDVTSGKFSIVLEEGQTFAVDGVYGGASVYTVPATTLTSENLEPTIAASKVTAEIKLGTKDYGFGDGSVIPAVNTVNWNNFVTSDGIIKFNNMKYHNDHGVCNAASGALTVAVSVPEGDSEIKFKGCQYAGDTTVITAVTEGISPASGNLKTTLCSDAIVFEYSGEAKDLVFTIDGGAIYLHGMTVTSKESAQGGGVVTP